VRSLDDIFAALAKSPFRQKFKLGSKERDYLATKGLATVLDHGRDFIDKRLAPALPVNDGKQTPMRGHPIFIAQHATATCCRGCLDKIHHIPPGRALDAGERDHVLAAIERWLRQQSSQQA
jgi:predicted Fe-S protein YdhL (DUF1289 family)